MLSLLASGPGVPGRRWVSQSTCVAAIHETSEWQMGPAVLLANGCCQVSLAAVT